MTTTIFLTTASAVLLYTTFAWLFSVWLKRADIIDPFWGPGFIVVLSAAMLASGSLSGQFRWVLFALVCIWGIRLGSHLFIRWWNEEHEDRRYAAMREAGSQLWWLRSLVTVFWLQAVILWIVATPLIFAVISQEQINPALAAVGFILFCVGLFFEAVGDFQLKAFKRRSNSQGQVLKTGLWKYTRHPNYFGDFTVWWGFFLTGLACGAPAWTVISPVIMSVLLMKVSGVGMLEKDISERRPAYAEYVQQTNAFFPWFPKQGG